LEFQISDFKFQIESGIWNLKSLNMLAFIILLFAESSTAASGGFAEFWNKYLNYPGFEAWKFINLAIFLGLLIYILKKPLSDAFKAKREEIRAELIQAEEEKQAAMAKLTEAETNLARLDTEKENVLTRAKEEAKAEEKRIASETETDVAKLREQANSEIARTAALARHELRKHSAEETVRLAEEMIKTKLGDQEDAKLVKAGIESLGGVK
jgi:F-type H+-transporting ATPase subunit b